MPTLRDRTGVIPDGWTRAESAAEAVDGAKILLPWSEELTLPEAHPAEMLGLHVENSVSVEALRPVLTRVGLISIAFPSFSDGRGFSIAKQLRGIGFRGRLRATGPVIADQFAYLLECGFDEVETPERLDARQPQPQWDAALALVSLSYQPGYPGRRSILDARRAAQGAAPQGGAA
ncbi:MAG: DUF934 domain-containing protein [Pseudomonadota bacterium]